MDKERKFHIAVAPTRLAKKWRNIEITLTELREKLETPVKTGETMAEYKAMPKVERDKRKDQGGFVGGRLKDGIRKKGMVVCRDFVTLDADNLPPGHDLIAIMDTLPIEYCYVIYPTHSSTPEAPRYRIIIPLEHSIPAEQYEPVARAIAKSIGIDYFDPTTYEPSRLMYWPSCPQDYEFKLIWQDGRDGALLNPDDVLSLYEDWHDMSTWPTGKTEAEIHAATLKKLGDPREKPGLIGMFCRAYTVPQAIDRFLPDAYTQCEDKTDRYTYSKGSTAGGLVIYDDGLHAYSHHATDPASGKDVNAFDLVRLHLFGARDENALPDTPVNKLPSYKAMTELCQADSEVKKLYGEDIKTQLSDDMIEDLPEGERSTALDWVDDLDRTRQGKILPSAHNMLLILRNDPKLKNRAALDLFSHRIMVLGNLPWRKHVKDGADVWSDADDAQLRNYVSETYEGLTGRQVLDDAFVEVVQKQAFHQVRDYWSTAKWDGVKRAETILIDYLGAEDTPYAKAVTINWLKGAVARVYHPGIKYDCCLVLTGPQGIGKSTLLSRLGGKWFSDSVTTFGTKDTLEQLQGNLIIELAEMQATNRAENDQIKAFLSRQVDKFRAPYGRRTEEYPRQCVFAATTNDDIFLKDRTGGRRFLIVPCMGNASKDLFKDLTEEVVLQIWLEVIDIYKKDKSLVLDKEAQRVARDMQEERTEGSEKVGLIADFLDKLLAPDWDEMSLQDRIDYIETADSISSLSAEKLKERFRKGFRRRDRVCAMEVWCECLGNQPRQMRNIDARGLNTVLQNMPGWKVYGHGKRGKLRFKLYGVQRAYYRESTLSAQLYKAAVGCEQPSSVANPVANIEDLM